MKIRILVFIFVLISYMSFSQEVDIDLLFIKERLDSIVSYTADIDLETDISFINMPRKKASVAYSKGKDLKFSSDDFVMLPKRGLDFSLNELFKYEFITVDRGRENRDGIDLKVLNIIPNDRKADFSIATLYLDTEKNRISAAEISTKKNGTYMISLQYENDKNVLPKSVEVSFELERLSIPLNFMGKNAKIDRKELKKDTPKEGKIYLFISNYKIFKK